MFENEVEYMSEDLVSNFRSGTIDHYIGSTFLNGYINYVTPIKMYLLERYRTQGKSYEERVWLPFTNYPDYHSDFNVLNDDVLVLAKTDSHYYFFWSDCDCSDCAIGRQKRGAIAEQEAIEWFDRYTKNLIEPKFLAYRDANREKFDQSEEEECSEGITGYREIPIKCFRGWVKF